MTIQQLSSGGASTPVAPGLAPTVTSITGANQNGLTFNLQDFLAGTKNLDNPDPSGQTTAIDPFTGSDPNARPNTPPGQWDVVGLDPFLYAGMQAEQAASGSTLPVPTATTGPETQSPGYQQFGQSWLDLLNTIGSNNSQWGGRNDFAPDLKGGGSVTPWDTTNLTTPWNSGNQQEAYYNAVDFISKNTGLDPSSKEAQQLGGAYLDYTLQNNNLYSGNEAEHASRNSNDKGIFGDILGPLETVGEIAGAVFGQPEITAGIAALQAGQDFAEGNTIGGLASALGAIGGGAGFFTDPGVADAFGITDTAGVISPADASLLSDIGTVGNVAQVAGGLTGVGQGISTGNIGEAIGGAVSAGQGGIGAYDSATGTTGTNASVSNNITSGLANTLGLDPSDLTKDLGLLNTAGTVAGAAVPLIEGAANAPSANDLGLTPATTTPPPSPASTPFVPSTPGTALTPSTADNPAKEGYKTPQGGNSTFGGGLGAESGANEMSLEKLLQELGQG